MFWKAAPPLHFGLFAFIMRHFLPKSDPASSLKSWQRGFSPTTSRRSARGRFCATESFVLSESWRSTLSNADRIVITGMDINTPLGDTLDGYLAGLLSGRSAVCRWKGVDTSRIYSKVGADLSEYDIDSKMA